MVAENKDNSKQTFLIVDDERHILEYLSAQLKHYGYRTITAADAKQAISLLKSNKPDIALIDIRLPDINGIELSKKISGLIPHVIIILMTGYPNIEDALQNVENQIFDYLIKPFKTQQLLMSLKRSKKYAELIQQNSDYKKKLDLLREENQELRSEIRKLIGNSTRNKKGIKSGKKNKYLDSYRKQQDYSK